MQLCFLSLELRVSPCRRKLTTLVAASSGSYAIPQEPSDGHSADIGEEEFGGNVEFGGAVINVLNILSGVGLLSVPYALKKAGWAGVGVLWLLGIITNYTGMHSLKNSNGKDSSCMSSLQLNPNCQSLQYAPEYIPKTDCKRA